MYIGRDGFVNDAAGFEDGAVQQGEPMEFHQDGEVGGLVGVKGKSK